MGGDFFCLLFRPKIRLSGKCSLEPRSAVLAIDCVVRVLSLAPGTYASNHGHSGYRERFAGSFVEVEFVAVVTSEP